MKNVLTSLLVLLAFASLGAEKGISWQKASNIPFKLVDNRIFVPVYLNGKGPFEMIFDTGAVAAITPEAARAAGLVIEDTGDRTGGVGESTVRVDRTSVKSVELGAVRLKDQEFAVIPMDDAPQVFGTQKVEGILGLPVFETAVTTIDYDRREITFADPKNYKPNPKAWAVPFTRPNQIPIIEASLDGISGRWGVDTGARTALIVANRFNEDNELQKTYHATFEGITGWGIGGPVRSLLARARTLKLGPVDVHDLVIRLSTQKRGLLANASYAGLIGPDVLRQFKVTFDYSRGTMYLDKSANYGQRDAYDRTGMWMGQNGNAFEVLDVIAGGPADKARIHKGDRITEIDGERTSKLLLPDARERLRRLPPGQKVRFRVGDKDVEVVLRDLV